MKAKPIVLAGFAIASLAWIGGLAHPLEGRAARKRPFESGPLRGQGPSRGWVSLAQSAGVQVVATFFGGGGGRRQAGNVIIEDALTDIGYADKPGNSAQRYAVLGRITDGNTPIGNVTVSDGNGHGAGSDASGNYTVANLPPGSYTFTATKTGLTFLPPTRVVSVPPAAAGINFSASAVDAYEPDDTCDQAKPVMTDGTQQAHTFHQAGDTDWVKFEGAAGMRYVIEGQVPLASRADLTLELYGVCTGPTLGQQDSTFSTGVRFEFTATVAGMYYAKFKDVDAGVFGSDTAYQLSVHGVPVNQPTTDAVIIVAGKAKSPDDVQPNIDHVTEDFYTWLVGHGFAADHVYFIAADALPGRTAPATSQNLQNAITIWAGSHLSPGGTLTLFVMDHGVREKIYLDKLNGEWFTSAQLNQWLNTLEATVIGVKINVIIETCYSGSFIDLPLPDTISKPGRVVITSSSGSEQALASDYGALFSDHLFGSLRQGMSLFASYQTALWATQAASSGQDPWIDDNGNGIANEPDDGKIAQQRYIVKTFSDGFAPLISNPFAIRGDKQATVQVNVVSDLGVRRVWAAIYPPSYQAPQGQDEIVALKVPSMTLALASGTAYSAVLTNLTEQGIYRIVINAEDQAGTPGQPVTLHVLNGQTKTYLPLVQR